MNKFAYAAEKFAAARRNLMLPHTQGEAESIKHAFHECDLGLRELDRDALDESASAWVRELEGLMDTSGLTDPTGERGTWAIKAEQLTVDEKIELSQLVDSLACWFARDDT